MDSGILFWARPQITRHIRSRFDGDRRRNEDRIDTLIESATRTQGLLYGSDWLRKSASAIGNARGAVLRENFPNPARLARALAAYHGDPYALEEVRDFLEPRHHGLIWLADTLGCGLARLGAQARVPNLPACDPVGVAPIHPFTLILMAQMIVFGASVEPDFPLEFQLRPNRATGRTIVVLGPGMNQEARSKAVALARSMFDKVEIERIESSRRRSPTGLHGKSRTMGAGSLGYRGLLQSKIRKDFIIAFYRNPSHEEANYKAILDALFTRYEKRFLRLRPTEFSDFNIRRSLDGWLRPQWVEVTSNPLEQKGNLL